MKFRVAALMIGGVVGLGATLIAAHGASGPEEHGRAAVPGDSTIELPGGSETISYREDRPLGEREQLLVPRGLHVKVQPADGGRPLRLDYQRGADTAGDKFARTDFATLEIPDGGYYYVTVAGGGSRFKPSLAFGRDFWHRLTSGGYLLGLTASLLAILASLGLLFSRGGLRMPSWP